MFKFIIFFLYQPAKQFLFFLSMIIIPIAMYKLK